MTKLTSSLPEDILKRLNDMAIKLAIPKNKIIEKALTVYLDQLNRAEYVKSYKRAAEDADILLMAEEGMEEYFKQLKQGMDDIN